MKRFFFLFLLNNLIQWPFSQSEFLFCGLRNYLDDFGLHTNREEKVVIISI